ncbi:hypothetical protein [Streptomyces sp. NPDC089919]|uniref:hypothetical protein n=1 Tax=Streptomyces sp. NPDC089919 TaxID=3155188 RepID=UPI0034213B9A
MTRERRALTALHLLLVWAAMAVAVPVLGMALFTAGWAGGGGAAAVFALIGVPLTVGLLAVAGAPARTAVPWCDTVSRRLGWAVSVFALGTAGALAGVAAWDAGVDLGGDGTRIALVGLPYAVAAALFVPGRAVRLGGVAVLAAGVAYGGFLGPAQARERRDAADLARLREHAELQYLAPAPPGMAVSRAEVGPASFGVDYRPVRQDVPGYVGLVLRPPTVPAPRCADLAAAGRSCTVGAHGELVLVTRLPGGVRDVTLIRRHGRAEAEVSSQSLDERGLRRLLDGLHPLTDAELGSLVREKKVDDRL